MLEAARRLGAEAGERVTEFGNRAAADEEPSRWGWSGKANGADGGQERQGGGDHIVYF